MRRLAWMLLLCGMVGKVSASAEEIQLETCDSLPVVQARVAGMKLLLLVDTAATSMLNVRSFPHGEARQVSVTSWNGTERTTAQEVVIGDLAIGQHHFKDLKLPAVDLSAIGRACGRQIDGIFGVDMLAKLGATVDLSKHEVHLQSESDSTEARIADLHRQLVACESAFNRADEVTFSDCLDPNIVLFAMGGDFYGRDAAMNYYREKYFHQTPPARLSIIPRAHHPLGDAMWVEYDLRIEVAQQTIFARGTALCQKTQGKWRIVHMNHSSPPVESSAWQSGTAK